MSELEFPMSCSSWVGNDDSGNMYLYKDALRPTDTVPCFQSPPDHSHIENTPVRRVIDPYL